MTHPLTYTGRHGGASLSSAPPQGIAVVAVPVAAFRHVPGCLRGALPASLRFPSPDHPASRQQVPGLRRPGTRVRPCALRSLQARVLAGVLLQGPLVLPLMPPEEGPALRCAARRNDLVPRPTSPLYLWHPEDAAAVLAL